MNQVTPYGNLTYTVGDTVNGIPQYTATQTLTKDGQELLDYSMGAQKNIGKLMEEQSGRLSGLLNRDLDFSQLPQAGQAPQYSRFGAGPQLTLRGGDTSGIQSSLGTNDFSKDRQRVESAMFSRLDPQIARQREMMETDLVNRGIRPGSAAHSAAMRDFNQSLNDQRTSILLGAGQEQSRLQDMALNAGNFTNSAQQQLYNQQMGNAAFGNAGRQQMYANQIGAKQANNALQDQGFNNQNIMRQNALNEMMLQRNTPLNELLALSGQGQLQQPNFVGTPQTGVAGTDVSGIMQNSYNQQQAGYNSMMGGLMSAGAGLLAAPSSSILGGLFALSDRRAKKDIERIGQTEAGTPLYKFRYKHGGPVQIGVMAQDLLETQPDAVVMGPDGFYRVDYGKVA